MKVRLPARRPYFQVSNILKSRGLHTICQSARCPNIGECWEHGTATFLLLGNICTRTCGFCAVSKGVPLPPDSDEPARVAEAVVAMDLKYAVITSVTRDDLEDGGAAHFSRTVREIREKSPGTKIEILIPDFGGNPEALSVVLESGPEILNHNLETVESLYSSIGRPPEFYRRSLAVLSAADRAGARTKSGLMIGLGEDGEDIIRTFEDLRGAGCDLLTIGQYLQPAAANPPVSKYYSPGEFEELRTKALSLGFSDVASGPLVRSSYEAERLYETIEKGE